MFSVNFRSACKLVMALGMVSCAEVDASPQDGAGATDSVALSAQSLQTSDLTFQVSVRGTGTAQIHARIFTNPAAKKGETVLAVHGLTETANTFENSAAAFFAEPGIGKKVARVIAIDMIGHGQSGFPQGLPAGTFGQLTIDDNVSVVIQSIHALRAQGLAPQTIVGHSMGGLAVQAAQHVLLTNGSSLAKLGITKAVLLAPVPVRDSPFSPAPGANPAPFMVTDPQLGTYLNLPPAYSRGQGYMDLAGVLTPATPSAAEIAQRGYVGFEPAVVLAQLTGTPIPTPAGPIVLPRPKADAGVFAADKGTKLVLVAFSQDQLCPIADLENLYVYLTGDASKAGFWAIVRSDAVHNMFITNPSGALDEIRELYL